MRQVVQYSGSGKIAVIDTPEPIVSRRRVKIRTLHSLISAGTERSKIELGMKSVLGKARARPDLVRKVIDKANREGLWATFETVRNRLAEATPLGYSIAGIVTEVGPEVEGFQPGDLVAAAGAGFANHAEYVVVPHTLVVKVPDGIDSELAAFSTVGAVAMQGVRQAAPMIGETFLVLGLGLIGQITTQILRANGCRVIGYDLVSSLVERAERSGATGMRPDDDPISTVLNHTDSHGVDGTIICASSAGNEPILLAGELTREKGRVVVVGAVRIDMPREPYYMKELDLRISRSYGPGRYDYRHEEGGIDYPYGYVRFTEARNMRAFLDLIVDGRLNIGSLITHRFPIDEAAKAYELLSGMREEPYLGIAISYPADRFPQPKAKKSIPAAILQGAANPALIDVSFIGAGNYATSKLLPTLRKFKEVRLASVCTASGRSAADVATRFGFSGSASTPEDIFAGPDQVVFIATRHSSHAALTMAALRAGKHVVVEKPLCVAREELTGLVEAFAQAPGQLLVGFNRRFAPFTAETLKHFGDAGIQEVVIRANVGTLPNNHWSLDPQEGGRVIGEACHFIDLASALTRSVPALVESFVALKPGVSALSAQTAYVQMRMRNGSLVSITYVADGAQSLPKERIECHGNGKSAVIEDWCELLLYSDKRSSKKTSTQNKGQGEMIAAFLAGIRSKTPALPPSAVFATSDATLSIIDSSCVGAPVTIADYSSLDSTS